ncbi:MAG: SDR family oxidoreductase [Alphaproteobacteria bacterium]|nr:SDR family oxidoreductase [Alphaproteobacteria bacterium]
MRFSGKHIVITGAASGLGLAIARAAEAEGALVTALDRNPSPFAHARICDVSDENAVMDALAHLSRIDGLVNAAGIALRLTVTDTDMADYDRLMAVNLRGSFLVSKLALPKMKTHGGAVLHFSSCVGVTGARNRAAYSASKGAIIALTRSMALDYATDKVRVNCLCPGFVDTPLLAKMPPERRARLAATHPLGRIGTVEDVTPMALFLISDQAAWITGQAIGVDGGFSAGHLEDI